MKSLHCLLSILAGHWFQLLPFFLHLQMVCIFASSVTLSRPFLSRKSIPDGIDDTEAFPREIFF